MPAVTADTLSLPRFSEPGPEDTQRPVVRVTTAPNGFEGEGFPVRRAFAGVPVTELDPFIHMDQMGSVDYGPGEPRGTSWHPHRGFETVTYMIDGTFQHQDSHGGGGGVTHAAAQSTCSRGAGAWAPRDAPSRAVNSPCSGPATASLSAPATARSPSRPSSSAASPFANRSPTTAPS